MTGRDGTLWEMPPAAVTLSQLTQAIGQAVRMSPALQGVWVTAELSDVRVSGGHCYMELIEKNAAGQTVAKLRATIWATRFGQLRQKFLQAAGSDIQTGMKVMLYGAASHHQLYGLSFNVNDIDPSYTLGDMERLRREILARLQREGVLDANKHVYMVPAPQRIAVISAAGAAGYGDFMHQLESNPDGFVFYTHLFDAVMQGERTSQSVRDALDYIEQTIDLWDCVAIVRGGGATTDLNGFDDYELARRVATFPLPVLVGIGHERDRTVLDEIAHVRLKTPTAVAAYLTDTLRGVYERTAGMADWVARYSADRVQGELRRLANCEAMLPALAETRLKTAHALLEREMTRIPVLVGARIEQASGRLDTLGRVAAATASGQMGRAGQQLDNIRSALGLAAKSATQRAVARLEALSGLVGALSPSNTLRRGYSVTRVNGKAVTQAAALRPGDILETTLHDGKVVSKVEIRK